MSKTYELNFYPTEKGDGIYSFHKTKAQAVNEFKRLEKKYPNRNGSAFIRVWANHDTPDEEPITDIDL